MRISTPYFNLYTASFAPWMNTSYYEKLKRAFKEYSIRLELNTQAIPVSLRWNMHPAFGFPRKPFNVYRRRGEYKTFKHVFTNQSIDVNGSHRINLPGGDVYLTVLHINLQTGQQCTVRPLNIEGKVIQYNATTLTSTGNVVIKCPFTRGILIEGNGEITHCGIVLQHDLINEKDWELIQIVGLPFNTGNIGGMGYDGTPQGFAGSPGDALLACLQRLSIGEALALPMPATGDALVPTPAWTPPSPPRYLDYLMNAGNSIARMIEKCLSTSDDLSFFPGQRQPAYVHLETIRGISQAGTGATQDAIVKIPVIAASLLAAGTDSFAALALGFGTTDMVSGSRQDNPNVTLSAVAPVRFGNGADYMVTANYIIRPQENFSIPLFDELSKTIEFAALGCEMPMPEIPNGLEALSMQKNRPRKIDEPCSESVKLRWEKGLTQNAYGIISSYKNGTSKVQNLKHVFQPDCYQVFNTAVAKAVSTQQKLADLADADRFIMTLPEEPVPDYGTEQHKYFVTGIDVFGRWSGFRNVLYNAVSPDKQNTGVIRIDLKNTVVDPPATVSVVNCELKIEFSWRWADRSPREIQFAGQYYTPGSVNPVQLMPARFSKSSANPIQPVISILFDAAGNPSCAQGVVSILPVPGGTPADLKKYSLVITNMQTTFTGASPHKAGFALFARALEKLRVPVNDFSDWSSEPYTCFLPDPRKPATVNIPAVVNFTALPDAAKNARGILTWAPAAGALAYHVWEANEVAIRTVIDQPLKNLFPSDSSRHLKPVTAPLQERANQLRDILTNAGGAYTSIIPLADKYFNRVTKDPLTQPKIELVLPGSSKVLHLFRVSSVNAANIDGDKSGITFFAVPQLVKPLAPRIELKKRKDETGTTPRYFFDVHVLHGDYAPVRAAEDPVAALDKVKAKGFELYRVRRQILISDVGAKGEVYKLADAVDWTDTNVSLLNGDVFKGKKISDEVTPSWRPYCYQAVAVGKNNPPFGEVSGRSEGSVTAVGYFFPSIKPIATFSTTESLTNAIVQRLVFSTDVPFEIVDGKSARIEVLHFNRAANSFESVKKFDAPGIRLSNVIVPMPVSPAILAQLPLINHLPTDAAGITKVSLLVPRTESGSSNPYNGLIRIVDPLGKFTELKF